jgi:hypothetical protein
MSKPTVKELLVDIPIASVVMGWPVILIMIVIFIIIGMLIWLGCGDNPITWLRWSAGSGLVVGWIAAYFLVSNYNVQ